MRFVLILFFLVSIISCSPKPVDQSKTDLASGSATCVRKEKVDQLHLIFDNYTSYPSYVIAAIGKSVIECLGVTAYMVELKRHYDSIMKNTASLKKHRAVASTDANKIGYQKRSELRSQYGNWRAINQSINVVGNVTEGVGDVLALGSIANPGFAAPATGFSLAGKYIKVLNVGTEMKAASYYDKLLDNSSYDRKKLSDALNSSANMGERLDAFRREFKAQSAGFVDLDKDLMDPHKFRGLEAALDQSLKLSGDLQLQLNQGSKSIDELKLELDGLDQTLTNHKENVITEVQKMAELQKQILDQQKNMDDRSIYLTNLAMKNMTTQEKIDAIENFGFGNFKSDQEKEKKDTLDYLHKKRDFEDLQEKITNFDLNFKNSMAILSNLGISSPILSDLAKVENVAMTLFQSYLQFQVGDPTAIIGGLAALTSLFRKDQKDQFQEQVMKQLKEITRLIQVTIELQYKTMGMIAGISDQLLFQGIEQGIKLDAIIELNRMSNVSNIVENRSFLGYCESILENIKIAILKDGRTNRELSDEGLLTPINKNIEPAPNSGRSGDDKIDYLTWMAKQMPDMPYVTSSKIESLLTPGSEMRRQLESCVGKIDEVAIHLSSHVKSPEKEPIHPAFTQSGENISIAPKDFFKNSLYLESIRQERIATIISMIAQSSKNKYKTPPYQIMYAGLNPSFSFSSLNKKIEWLRKNSEMAKRSVISVKSAQLVESSLFSSIEPIDSRFLSSFLRSYLQIHQLSHFLNPDPLMDTTTSNSKNIESLAMLVELAVFQKVLQGGDVLLAIYNSHFDPTYKMESETPIKGSLIDDVIADTNENFKKEVNRLIQSSPSILNSLIKYRLINAMKTESRFMYMLKYELADKSGYPDLLSDLYKKIGMEIFMDGPDNKLYARFPSLVVKQQEAAEATKQENQKTDAEKYADAQTGKVAENAEIARQRVLILQFQNKIEIISPEEMTSDRTESSEEILELLSLRDRLLSELYHYTWHTSAGSSDKIYQQLRNLVVQ